MEFDDINKLKDSEEKNEKLSEWYRNHIQVSNWLTLPFQNSIIKYHNRVEYKKNGNYHRLNGPAIEFTLLQQVDKDKYYIEGILYEDVSEWKKISTQKLRRLKLLKLSKH